VYVPPLLPVTKRVSKSDKLEQVEGQGQTEFSISHSLHFSSTFLSIGSLLVSLTFLAEEFDRKNLSFSSPI